MGSFDPSTQRRTENLESIRLLPAAEVLPQTAPGGLAGLTGRTVILTVYNNDWSAGGLVCRVVDTDEIWALVLADEGKKREREMLIRLDDVKSVKEA